MDQDTFTSALQTIELPFHSLERWEQLKRLYVQLETVRDAKDTALLLREIYRESGNETEHLNKTTCHCKGDVGDDLWPFCGLQYFLEELASGEEKQRFFCSTLPFIASLASGLMEFAPSCGVPLMCRQRGTYTSIQETSDIYLSSLFVFASVCKWYWSRL